MSRNLRNKDKVNLSIQNKNILDLDALQEAITPPSELYDNEEVIKKNTQKDMNIIKIHKSVMNTKTESSKNQDKFLKTKRQAEKKINNFTKSDNIKPVNFSNVSSCVECHQCRKEVPLVNVLNCLNKNCNKSYCLSCVSKYSKNDIFNECYFCKNVCICERCKAGIKETANDFEEKMKNKNIVEIDGFQIIEDDDADSQEYVEYDKDSVKDSEAEERENESNVQSYQDINYSDYPEDKIKKTQFQKKPQKKSTQQLPSSNNIAVKSSNNLVTQQPQLKKEQTRVNPFTIHSRVELVLQRVSGNVINQINSKTRKDCFNCKQAKPVTQFKFRSFTDFMVFMYYHFTSYEKTLAIDTSTEVLRANITILKSYYNKYFLDTYFDNSPNFKSVKHLCINCLDKKMNTTNGFYELYNTMVNYNFKSEFFPKAIVNLNINYNLAPNFDFKNNKEFNQKLKENLHYYSSASEIKDEDVKEKFNTEELIQSIKIKSANLVSNASTSNNIIANSNTSSNKNEISQNLSIPFSSSIQGNQGNTINPALNQNLNNQTGNEGTIIKPFIGALGNLLKKNPNMNYKQIFTLNSVRNQQMQSNKDDDSNSNHPSFNQGSANYQIPGNSLTQQILNQHNQSILNNQENSGNNNQGSNPGAGLGSNPIMSFIGNFMSQKQMGNNELFNNMKNVKGEQINNILSNNPNILNTLQSISSKLKHPNVQHLLSSVVTNNEASNNDKSLPNSLSLNKLNADNSVDQSAEVDSNIQQPSQGKNEQEETYNPESKEAENVIKSKIEEINSIFGTNLANLTLINQDPEGESQKEFFSKMLNLQNQESNLISLYNHLLSYNKPNETNNETQPNPNDFNFEELRKEADKQFNSPTTHMNMNSENNFTNAENILNHLNANATDKAETEGSKNMVFVLDELKRQFFSIQYFSLLQKLFISYVFKNLELFVEQMSKYHVLSEIITNYLSNLAKENENKSINDYINYLKTITTIGSNLSNALSYNVQSLKNNGIKTFKSLEDTLKTNMKNVIENFGDAYNLMNSDSSLSELLTNSINDLHKLNSIYSTLQENQNQKEKEREELETNLNKNLKNAQSLTNEFKKTFNIKTNTESNMDMDIDKDNESEYNEEDEGEEYGEEEDMIGESEEFESNNHPSGISNDKFIDAESKNEKKERKNIFNIIRNESAVAKPQSQPQPQPQPQPQAQEEKRTKNIPSEIESGNSFSEKD